MRFDPHEPPARVQERGVSYAALSVPTALASHAINTGRRDHCRAWARAIHTARPDLDGLWHQSSMTGGDAVTLFAHAADTFPDRPRISLRLDHPGLRGHLLAAAAQVRYRVV